MPAEAQYKAVDRIEQQMRFLVKDALDSVIVLPKSEAELARAKLKPEQRHHRRRTT